MKGVPQTESRGGEGVNVQGISDRKTNEKGNEDEQGGALTAP